MPSTPRWNNRLQPQITQMSTDLIGIVGGLGPRASAEFVRTIYEQWQPEREQETPRVVLYSDPTFPDRTEAVLKGREDELLDRLVNVLTQLHQLGASQFVICCITIHNLLPRLPNDLRSRTISLLDVIFDAVANSHKRHLLFCTTGARQLRLYEEHERWADTAALFVMPDALDQQEIHRLIYRIKQNQHVAKEHHLVESLLNKYGVTSFIAGCTEIHLLASQFGPRCLDPLTEIARQLAHPEAFVAVGASTQ